MPGRSPGCSSSWGPNNPNRLHFGVDALTIQICVSAVINSYVRTEKETHLFYEVSGNHQLVRSGT